MQFSELSQHLEKLEQTNSRLEMMYQLSDLYKNLGTNEVKIASYLMQGSLVPAYLSLEFQLSVKMVVRALAQLHCEYSKDSAESMGLFGETDNSASIKQLTKNYKENGDIGIVASNTITTWKESCQINDDVSLNIEEVYEKLVKIAHEGGSGSQDRKLQKLTELFKLSDPSSAKFIARIVIGKLRLGFSAMTILDALSWAVTNSKIHRKFLELAYQKKADVGELAQVYLQLAKTELGEQENNTEGMTIGKEDAEIQEKILTTKYDSILKKLDDKYEVSVGIPVVPALCQRINTAKEIIEKMGTVIAEPKYDGLRVQIHYSKNGFDDGTHVRAYTRNLEEVTHMFPELDNLGESIKTDDCIFDSEAIGYDLKTDELLPFQATITRRRKHKVGEASKKVPIRFYIFDVLYSGKLSLLENKLQERKDLLKEIIIENRTIKIAYYSVITDPVILHDFHERQLEEGLEGAVIKQIDSKYQSGRKGWSWVKIKETEGSSGKLKDTLDLVVMGYYYGRGKRSKFGVGAFLVGVLNEKQEIKTIAKVGTGLTDDQFIELKNRGNALEVETKPIEYEVTKAILPDVWMRPELVVEIAADEITKSPNHSAKVALRFPRLISFRDDKNWVDATTIKELANF
jgi:DNA ligase-1